MEVNNSIKIPEYNASDAKKAAPVNELIGDLVSGTKDKIEGVKLDFTVPADQFFRNDKEGNRVEQNQWREDL